MRLIASFRAFAIALFATLGLSRLAVHAAEPDPNFHLYLLIGQSNMAGRGTPDAESKQPHPRVQMLTKDLQWALATDPMHFDKPVAGVGPGVAFGKVMADANPGVKVGLVPCAMGGSKIEEWAPGTKNHTAMLARMRAATKAGVLKGILWHQGESNLAENSTYTTQFEALIRGVRQEFGAGDVPVVAGEITAFKPDKTAVEKFNAILHGMVDKVARFACVKTQDLKDKGDKLHYDTASARELGRRYAAAMRGLQK